jgi:hypothetical protein
VVQIKILIFPNGISILKNLRHKKVRTSGWNFVRGGFWALGAQWNYFSLRELIIDPMDDRKAYRVIKGVDLQVFDD